MQGPPMGSKLKKYNNINLKIKWMYKFRELWITFFSTKHDLHSSIFGIVTIILPQKKTFILANLRHLLALFVVTNVTYVTHMCT